MHGFRNFQSCPELFNEVRGDLFGIDFKDEERVVQERQEDAVAVGRRHVGDNFHCYLCFHCRLKQLVVDSLRVRS